MRTWKSIAGRGSIIAVLAAALPMGAAAASTPAGCTDAGDTGLTAVISATPGQHITGVIDASACNLGVYVGPGVNNVVISRATITGSLDHAIFVQDANDVKIVHDLLRGDVTSPTSGIAEDKAIELVGTTRGIVGWNTVNQTVLSGGIGLSDDGPLDPGAPNPGNLMPSEENLVIGNQVLHSGTDCGIVLAAYNEGSGGVMQNTVVGNTVRANVAGVVVAADTPDTVASGNQVVRNRITGNTLPGVILHSNAPDDVVSYTVVAQNLLSGNGADTEAMGGAGPTDATAIILAGEVESVTNSSILANKIQPTQTYGIWIGNSTGTYITGLHRDRAPIKVFRYRGTAAARGV